MKFYNIYENQLDKTWYNSSTVVYSECDDKENELKTVRVTFKDGRTYQYTEVLVNDYLLFRENSSQGKALNKYLRKYPCEKIDARDVALLTEEMYSYTSGTTSSNCDYYVELYDEKADVFCQGNKMETVSLEDTPKNVLEHFMKAVEIQFEVKEEEK